MATAYSVEVMVFVNPGHRNKAREAALVVDPVGGGNTFQSGVNPSGQEKAPPSLYWCNWQMTPAQAATFRAELDARNVNYTWVEADKLQGQRTNPMAELAGRGMKKRQKKHLEVE